MAQPVVTLTVNPAVVISSSVEHVVPERKLRCRQPRKERIPVRQMIQAYEEATSIAVSCQTVPLVPCSRPTKKQSTPTSSPGRCASTCRSGSG